MGTTIVRYHPKTEHADENQRLVEAVFEELAATTPAGLSYTTFRLSDGTFIHIADIEGADNPLNGVAAFAEFLKGIGERCEPGNGPNPQQATVIGAYQSPERSAES